jgi:hypothetical protein
MMIMKEEDKAKSDENIFTFYNHLFSSSLLKYFFPTG